MTNPCDLRWVTKPGTAWSTNRNSAACFYRCEVDPIHPLI